MFKKLKRFSLPLTLVLVGLIVGGLFLQKSFGDVSNRFEDEHVSFVIPSDWIVTQESDNNYIIQSPNYSDAEFPQQVTRIELTQLVGNERAPEFDGNNESFGKLRALPNNFITDIEAKNALIKGGGADGKRNLKIGEYDAVEFMNRSQGGSYGVGFSANVWIRRNNSNYYVWASGDEYLYKGLKVYYELIRTLKLK
jgi:hypothetical protein